MNKFSRVQYSIKTCLSGDFEQMENLLNSMSVEGWELYSIHEVEVDGEYVYSCIFMRDVLIEDEQQDDLDLAGFKSRMERIMTPKSEPYDICIDIQKKIKDKRLKIAQIKTLLDSTSEDNRAVLNSEISVTIQELEDLKRKLIEVASPDIMQNKIGQNKLGISLSEELLDVISPDSEVNLISELVRTRQKLVDNLGYIIPKVKIDTDDSLQANEFVVNVRGIPAIKAFSYPGYVMYFKDELNLSKLPKNAIKDIDFITGKEIIWLDEDKTKDFWAKGLNATEFVGRILEFTALKHIEDIFDYSDVNRYIEIVGAQNLYLIENIIPDFISVSELKYILANLIKENVSIKDILFIFEKLNDFADEASKEDLLSKLRVSLARQITLSLPFKSGMPIQAFELNNSNLEYITKQIEASDAVKINNTKIEKLVSAINTSHKKFIPESKEILLIVPAQLRHVLYLILSQFIPNIRVIAKEELLFDYPVEILATV